VLNVLNINNFEDPAKADPELEKKLKENKKIAEARTAEVILNCFLVSLTETNYFSGDGALH
jgi:hypothetical protein